ncbi:MAG: hypothetical protein HZA03_08690 [Nitrospinae bacterium]|nr:hypothetical protein [Nitrospinota bacterium]
MHKITITLIIGFFIGFGAQANACQMKAAATPAEAAGQQDVYAQRMALMQERDALLLETVQLLKDVAKDKGAKTKAEALEQRIQANIEKHNKMHTMMMGGAGGMGGMEPQGGMMHKKDGCCGGKDNPCPMKPGAPADKKAD